MDIVAQGSNNGFLKSLFCHTSANIENQLTRATTLSLELCSCCVQIPAKIAHRMITTDGVTGMG